MFNRIANLKNRHVLGILLFVALLTSGLSLMFNFTYNVDTSPGWWVSWLQNFSTEMFGAFLTFILLEIIVGGREKRRDLAREEQREKERLVVQIEQEKEHLIRRMGSKINSEAIRAVEELRAHGWLEDGSLQGAYLGGANLKGANLESANLQGAKLHLANLQNANLVRANLQRADLWSANLRNAIMEVTVLENTGLKHADMQRAILSAAYLQGANMSNANLHEVKFDDADFDEDTTLPDNTEWQSHTDVTRFTNPHHPDFWRPDPKDEVWWDKPH